MMVKGWVCRKGWDSRHQSYHHLHWWEGLSSVQGTYFYGGYGVPWQENATEVSCGLTMVVFYVRGRNLILFFLYAQGVPPGGKYLFSPSCLSWACNPRSYWERSLTLWQGSLCSLPGLVLGTGHTRLHRSGSGHAHRCILLGNKI